MKFVLNYNLERRLKIIINEKSGLYTTVRCTLLCSWFMGLFPLSGLIHPASNKLRFSLRTPYFVYYMISLFGQVLMFLMTCYWITERGISLSNIRYFFFYSTSLLGSLILLKIARCWPELIKKVEAIESKLPPFHRNVALCCNFTTALMLIAALVEHLLSVLYGLSVAYSCESENVYETFFRFIMPWIFDYTPYTLWKGILIEIFNVQSTFIWSYIDVVIIVLSIYLAEHFSLHNELLKKAVEHDNFDCSAFRIHYLKIVRLVKLINKHIGLFILASFGINVYWICTQLFYNLNKTRTGQYIACQNRHSESDSTQTHYGMEHNIYFVFSLSFLLLRTLLVLLLAARINSTSVGPLIILYNVPNSKFNIEVERYISQIKNIKVALSGLDFFYVTRKMILTLLRTIVTYELVLLQFNK